MSGQLRLVNPICVYDFTLFDGEDEKPVIELLEKWCKKWCFQLEKAPTTGNLHFQGRFSLKVKERLRLPFCEKFGKMKLSATSGENRDNMFYVMKEDSRVNGPWMDTDEKIYVPRDILAIKELRPWQQSLVDIMGTYDSRKVDYLYCPFGNSGKTTLVRWCMCYKIARKLPMCNDFLSIMRMVMCMPVSKAYMIDMPRAINKEKLFQLYSGIEEVKGGYAYDDRYKFKDRIFDPPRVIVFSNKLPNMEMLSLDRWNIWCIVNNELVEWKEPEVFNPPMAEDYEDVNRYLNEV